MSIRADKSRNASASTGRKPKLSKFDKELAAAVNEASRDAVNFHHAAGRSVFGRIAPNAELSEILPPTSELVTQ